METVVKGLAVYLRKIERRHGEARQFAERCKAMGLSWVAIGGVWQEHRDGRVRHGLMNAPSDCRAFADALANLGITPYVWGYPWIGGEELFITDMLRCSGDHRLILLDPELGANPTRSMQPGPMRAANESARKLVHGLRTDGAKRVGLSTFGIPPRWFPLDDFLAAGLDFVGGQTYTDDANVDRSIAFFTKRIQEHGGTVQLVPNFGLYSWQIAGGEGVRKARAKRPDELRSHLMEFIDDGEPVEAMIGWAENFITKNIEAELASFARLMARGACRLPRSEGLVPA